MPTQPYGIKLAGGISSTNFDPPFELFAGESDIVTDQGQAAAVAIEQFRVIARDEAGLLAPWNPTGGSATLAGTFSGVGTADDTITINGVVMTLKAAAANSHEVTIGGTATATAANLVAKLNAIPDEVGVTASNTGAVVTLTAIVPGTDGNGLAVAESGTGFSFAGGATALAGGSEESENKAIGIAAQPIAAAGWGPYFTGGQFNHEALVWPATVTSLAQRKRAFDGTNIGVRHLL